MPARPLQTHTARTRDELQACCQAGAFKLFRQGCRMLTAQAQPVTPCMPQPARIKRVAVTCSLPKVRSHRFCAEQEDAVRLSCSADACHSTQRSHHPVGRGSDAGCHRGGNQCCCQEQGDAPAPAVAQPPKQAGPDESTHEHQL